MGSPVGDASLRPEVSGSFFVPSAICIWSSVLPDAARPSEGHETKHRHHHSVKNCESYEPEDRSNFPLTPGGQQAIGREDDEHCAGGFVEHLTRDARERTKRYAAGAPERREHIRAHATIVVQARGVAGASVGQRRRNADDVESIEAGHYPQVQVTYLNRTAQRALVSLLYAA